MKRSRWLTAEQKEEILQSWEDKKTVAVGASDGYDNGYPDPAIIPLCDQINALDGVCTLQSCAGHVVEDGLLRSGHLWLWMSRRKSREFDHRAFQLSRRPLMERIGKIYGKDGREITSLTFAGEERDLLAESGALILRFLRSLEG